MDSNEQQHLQREMALYVPVEKADMKRISYGVVLEPDTEDLQGDILEAEEIEKAAHDWMVNSQKGGLMHTELVPGAKVVESFISPADFYVQKSDGNMEKVARGSWVLGIQWPENIWKRIISGELTGFSVGGSGVRVEVDEVKKVGPKGWVGGSFVNYARHGGNPAPEEGGRGKKKPPQGTAHGVIPTPDETAPSEDLTNKEEMEEKERDQLPPSKGAPAQPPKPMTPAQIAEEAQREEAKGNIEAERKTQQAAISGAPAPGDKVMFEVPDIDDPNNRIQVEAKVKGLTEHPDLQGMKPGYEIYEVTELGEDGTEFGEGGGDTWYLYKDGNTGEWVAEYPGDELSQTYPAWQSSIAEPAAPAGLVAENRGRANIENSRRAGYMDASEDYELLEMDDDTIRGMVKENSQRGTPISQAEVDAYMEGVQQARNEAGVGPGSGSYEYIGGPSDADRLAAEGQSTLSGAIGRQGGITEGPQPLAESLVEGYDPAEVASVLAEEYPDLHGGMSNDDIENFAQQAWEDNADAYGWDPGDEQAHDDFTRSAILSAQAMRDDYLVQDLSKAGLEVEPGDIEGFAWIDLGDNRLLAVTPIGGGKFGSDIIEDEEMGWEPFEEFDSLEDVIARAKEMRGSKKGGLTKRIAKRAASLVIQKVGPKGWAPGPYANYQRHGGSPSKERPKKKSPEEQGASRFKTGSRVQFADGATGTIEEIEWGSLGWDTTYRVKLDPEFVGDDGQEYISGVKGSEIKGNPRKPGAGSGISESEYQSMIADIRTNTQAMTQPKHTTRDGVVIEDQPKVTRVGGEQFQMATPKGQVVLDFAAWKWLGDGGTAKSPKVTERAHWGVIPRDADEDNPENYIWAKNETLAELMNRLPPGEYKLAR